MCSLELPSSLGFQLSALEQLPCFLLQVFDEKCLDGRLFSSERVLLTPSHADSAPLLCSGIGVAGGKDGHPGRKEVTISGVFLDLVPACGA